MAKAGKLGRGLGLLVEEASAETAGLRADSTLPIKDIEANKAQPRKSFKKDELDELADSIRQNGVLQPLLVRKVGKSYQIVAGERRYQAAKLAGLDEVPVIIRNISDNEVLKLALIENLQRSDLTPLEEARGYRALIDENSLTQEQLAKAVSKSRPAIANALRLLELPDEVQGFVEEGALTAGHARAILAAKGEEAQMRLARKAAEEHLSVRQTEALAPLFAAADAAEQPRRASTPKSFKSAAKAMRQALGTNVRVKTVRGRNKIEIEFADEDELDRLVDQIARSDA